MAKRSRSSRTSSARTRLNQKVRTANLSLISTRSIATRAKRNTTSSDLNTKASVCNAIGKLSIRTSRLRQKTKRSTEQLRATRRLTRCFPRSARRWRWSSKSATSRNASSSRRCSLAATTAESPSTCAA